MLKLYNAGTSVCSVKARIGLAEKGLEWEDVMLVLPNGDQHKPEYRKLNPNGVVPTLVDDDTVVIESGVILQYIDELGGAPFLMPDDLAGKAETLVWLLRGVEIHQAINTMSFATSHREKWLTKTYEEIEALIKAIPNPRYSAKRRDLIENGVASSHVVADFYVLANVFEDMGKTLATSEWMNGDTYGLADISLLAYIDRLDRIAMSGLWQTRQPRISEWLDAGRARPGYRRAIEPYASEADLAEMKNVGQKFWPEVSDRWDTFLSNRK